VRGGTLKRVAFVLPERFAGPKETFPVAAMFHLEARPGAPPRICRVKGPEVRARLFAHREAAERRAASTPSAPAPEAD